METEHRETNPHFEIGTYHYHLPYYYNISTTLRLHLY